MYRRSHRPLGVALALALLLVAPAVRAGTTGKLTGVVTNEKKEPLPGVNVRIVGQRLGALTDENGRYNIVGVPAGQGISAQFNLLGYGALMQQNITVAADFTTEVNVSLKKWNSLSGIA